MQRSRSIAISGDSASGFSKWRLGSMNRERPRPQPNVMSCSGHALVAHRAVQRVVDQQELDDRVLGVADPVGLRVDDHAVLDGSRT
jgi:hypothetical protein